MIHVNGIAITIYMTKINFSDGLVFSQKPRKKSQKSPEFNFCYAAGICDIDAVGLLTGRAFSL